MRYNVWNHRVQAAHGQTASAVQPIELDCADGRTALQMTRWLSHLRAERRLSPKTLEAYSRDVRQCLDLPQRALGRASDAYGFCRAGSQRCQSLHGDAPRRRYCRPLADAGAGGLAFVRPLSGAGGQGQGRRTFGHPRAQSCKKSSKTDPDGGRQTLCRCR